MKLRIKDIALETGIDQATISRVLQGRAREFQIGRERERFIQATAERMGYRPNAFAQSMRQGKFNLISLLLVEKASNWLKTPLLESLVHHLSLNGYALQFTLLRDEEMREKASIPKIFTHQMVDGVFVATLEEKVSKKLAPMLEKFNLPAIWLNAKSEFDSIYVDNIHAGMKATDNLLRKGHRNIVFLGTLNEASASEKNLLAADFRYLGYKRCMESNGLSPRVVPCKDGDYFKAVSKYLNEAVFPSALLCSYQNTLDLTIEACLKLGVKVPNDLSIVSFANIGENDSKPHIGRMVSNENRRGEIAVEMLLRKIAKPKVKLVSKSLKMTYKNGRSVKVLN